VTKLDLLLHLAWQLLSDAAAGVSSCCFNHLPQVLLSDILLRAAVAAAASQWPAF
jgi:hypothetical protein